MEKLSYRTIQVKYLEAGDSGPIELTGPHGGPLPESVIDELNMAISDNRIELLEYIENTHKLPASTFYVKYRCLETDNIYEKGSVFGRSLSEFTIDQLNEDIDNNLIDIIEYESAPDPIESD